MLGLLRKRKLAIGEIRVAAPDQNQVAIQPAFRRELSARLECCVKAILGAELRERQRSRKKLHVRRRHKVFVRALLVQCVARLRVYH